MSTIKVKLTKSTIGQPKKLRLVVRALGLTKMHRVKELKDNNCTRGMINKVNHLVSYELSN